MTNHWIEGHIADWSSGSGCPRGHIYLIETIKPYRDVSAMIAFRKLDSWHLYTSIYSIDGDGASIVREPTDEEYALIARKRLTEDA